MRALGVIVVLIAVAFGAAYLMGWVNVSTNRGDSSINVKVNQVKVNEDTAKARDAVQNVGQKVKQEVAGDGAVRGRLVSVNGQEVAIAVEGKETMTVTANATTTVTRENQSIALADLREGETVAVVFKTEAGKRVAQSIAAQG